MVSIVISPMTGNILDIKKQKNDDDKKMILKKVSAVYAIVVVRKGT